MQIGVGNSEDHHDSCCVPEGTCCVLEQALIIVVIVSCSYRVLLCRAGADQESSAGCAASRMAAQTVCPALPPLCCGAVG